MMFKEGNGSTGGGKGSGDSALRGGNAPAPKAVAFARRRAEDALTDPKLAHLSNEELARRFHMARHYFDALRPETNQPTLRIPPPVDTAGGGYSPDGVLAGVRYEDASPRALDNLRALLEGRWRGDATRRGSRVRVFMTDELAGQIIDRHAGNPRNLNRGHVRMLMRQMRANLFGRCVDPVMLAARDSRAGNGQHRLHAIRETGIGQWLEILFDATEEEIQNTDRGLRRKAADTARETGGVHRPELAMPRMIALASLLNEKATATEHAELFPYYERVRDAADWVSDTVPRSFKLGTQWPAAALILARHAYPEPTRVFLDLFRAGEGGNGVSALAATLMNNAPRGRDFAIDVLRAVQAYIEDERIRVLRARTDTLAFFTSKVAGA